MKLRGTSTTQEGILNIIKEFFCDTAISSLVPTGEENVYQIHKPSGKILSSYQVSLKKGRWRFEEK